MENLEKDSKEIMHSRTENDIRSVQHRRVESIIILEAENAIHGKNNHLLQSGNASIRAQ